MVASRLVADRLVSGQLVADRLVDGRLLARRLVAGQLVADRLVAGQLLATRWQAGRCQRVPCWILLTDSEQLPDTGLLVCQLARARARAQVGLLLV